MATLSIPERYQFGVSKIRDLDMDTVRAIRASLDSFVYGEEPPEASVVAASALEAVSRSDNAAAEDSKKISEALISMYMAKSKHDTPLEEFANGIAEALELLPDEKLRLAPGEREAFREKLRILLDAEVFGIISNVDDLRTENERIFCHARIMTDLRPVFGSEVKRGPAAILVILVTHNLKIAFHESGRKGDHDFYVSLDAQDLEALKDLIARAEAKASSLRSAVASNIKLFGVRE